jgi:hypothetical protein
MSCTASRLDEGGSLCDRHQFYGPRDAIFRSAAGTSERIEFFTFALSEWA